MAIRQSARAEVQSSIDALTADDGERAGSSFLASGPLWAVVGFLCGAVFWHMVGFWGFVGELVSRGPSPEQRAASAMVSGAACITLVLDRETGETRSESCPALIAALPDSRRNYRGSLTLEARARLIQPERWSITVSDTFEAAGEGAARKAD